MSDYIKQFDELFEELVPEVGPAATVAGEIVRAMCRIAYRYYNDGDRIGVDYGNETCNAAARYLMFASNGMLNPLVNALWGISVGPVTNALWGISVDSTYEVRLQALAEGTLQFLEENPELRKAPNTTDMFDFSEPSDYDYDEDEEDYEW